MTQRPSQPNLVALLEQQVLPRLFERLDQAFPEFGWERTSDGWVATTRETTKHVLNARPERVVCNRPYGFYAHGGEARTWVAYVSGETQPRGSRFVAAVERLCELAGLPSPGRAHSPQEAEALAQAEARRGVLARATQLAQSVLRGAEGAQARAYAERRGLSLEAQEELAVGLWPSVGEVRRAIPPELHAAAQDAGLFREQFAGYLVVPWLDAWGRPLTLYFRWPGSELPQGLPKTQALPGAGTKSSPLYYDRAKHAGHSDLVLVEGVFDAAVLQARGQTQVVACVAAQLSKAQVETLERNRVDSVTLVLDPDQGGEAGTRSCLKSLAAAGIQAYVAPTLPDGLDPNEFVLRDGLDAWREHLRGALTGPCYLAQRALQGVRPESPRPEREAALRRVGEVIEQLQGRTAARERAELVRVTAKATGFAASHLKAELPPAGGERPARAPGAAAEPVEPLHVPYREDPSGLVWVRERFDKDGRLAYDDVPLANFCARITAEITEDDGAEERRVFEVTAQLHGTTQVVQVPALQFQGLQWVLGQLGASATLEPGKALQDRVRHGIQVLSGIPPSERVYTHLGWRELEDDGWAFLHAEGAIGADGAQEDVRIKVGDPLERFALPAPPEGAELEKALAACLSFLQLAPERLTVPLLALPFRAALGEADFTAFLYGSSGGHKSCLAALVQQFFGQGLHYQNLPGSWLSSANALEGTLFLAKDTVFVIDDFVPAGSVSDRARRHRDADRVLRGQGNRAGRSRMRCDASLRPAKRSRALVLCTGEELPRGESLTARFLTLPMAPGDVDRGQLSACQADADAGRYAQALAAFLHWLAPRYANVQAGLRDEVGAIRGEFALAGAHGRLVDVGANLFLGLRAFLRFAQEQGGLSPEEAQALLGSCRHALLQALGQQVQSQHESDPIQQFFELLVSCLASGRGHVAGLDGNVPRDQPLAWGWRLSDEGQAEGTPWRPGADERPHWRAQGERAGWVEGDDLYLDPTVAMNLVQRAAGEEGFALSIRSLRRRLKEEGHLQGMGRARDTSSVRISVSGARRSVLHLRASTVLDSAQPEDGGPHD